MFVCMYVRKRKRGRKRAEREREREIVRNRDTWRGAENQRERGERQRYGKRGRKRMGVWKDRHTDKQDKEIGT